jgi:hypothetical protein
MRFELQIATTCLAVSALLAGCAGRSAADHASARLSTITQAKPVDSPVYDLRADATWQLNPPDGERFDASGLLWTTQGSLLTINDRGFLLYRIEFSSSNAASLVPMANSVTEFALAPFQKEKAGRYDCEGIAGDGQGRLYICEEANRWVLRLDPLSGGVERLNIDWSPLQKYFSRDPNASFEGIAIGNGLLYLANERKLGRIVAVNLETLRVVDDFFVRAAGSNARDVHYSDLSWFDGALFVLLRQSRCVLQINPESHRVIAQYNFEELERNPETRYKKLYPTGNMEGLAVDRDFIWLVTDNNGLGRVRYPSDRRPTLFRCPRPDRS